MCCTFGDQNDIEWYQIHDLPLRVAIDESGTMTELSGDYEGMSTVEARESIIKDLDEEGYLLETEDITHTVQVHERCGTGIEFLVTEQWYIKVLDKKTNISRQEDRWTGTQRKCLQDTKTGSRDYNGTGVFPDRETLGFRSQYGTVKTVEKLL